MSLKNYMWQRSCNNMRLNRRLIDDGPKPTLSRSSCLFVTA